jgi:hypothetical protein
MNEQRINIIGTPQQYHGFSILIQGIPRVTGDTFQAIIVKDGKFYQHNVFIKYAKKQTEFRGKELKRAYTYMMIMAQSVCEMIEDPKKMAKAKEQQETDVILDAMKLKSTPRVKV